MTIFLFLLLSFITYFLISVVGQLTGSGSGSLVHHALQVIKPLPLLLLVISNIFFAVALAVGFKFTQYAIPAAIAIGVISSFIYSAIFLGGFVTLLRIAGIFLILAGIYLLR